MIFNTNNFRGKQRASFTQTSHFTMYLTVHVNYDLTWPRIAINNFLNVILDNFSVTFHLTHRHFPTHYCSYLFWCCLRLSIDLSFFVFSFFLIYSIHESKQTKVRWSKYSEAYSRGIGMKESISSFSSFALFLFIGLWSVFDWPWTALERSISVKLLKEGSLSPRVTELVRFFFFRFSRRAFESPHIFVPPWVEGMLRMAIPWRVGPSAKFKAIPSHWERQK